jgi:hypothetical protein
MLTRRLRKILIASGAGSSLTIAAAAAHPQLAASASDVPRDVGCRTTVERRLAAWGAGAERYRDADGMFGARQWRIATNEIGTWLLLQELSEEMPAVARVDERWTTRATFDAECREALASELRAAPIGCVRCPAGVRAQA